MLLLVTEDVKDLRKVEIICIEVKMFPNLCLLPVSLQRGTEFLSLFF